MLTSSALQSDDDGRRSPRLPFAVALLVYGLVFNLVYDNWIVVKWASFGDASPTTAQYLLAIVAFVAPAAYWDGRVRRPSDAIVMILQVLVVVPTAVVLPRTSEVSVDEQISYLVVVVLALYVVTLLSRKNLPSPTLPIITERLFWPAVTIFVVLSYLSMLARFGTQISLDVLSDVHEQRAFYKGNRGGGLAARAGTYLLNWTAYVVNPFLIGYGLLVHRKWIAVTAISGQMFLFFITGFRQVLLSGLLITVLIWALSSRRRSFGKPVAIGIAIMTAAAYVIDRLTRSILVSNLLVRRMIAVPGRNSAHYLDFFTENPKANLGHAFLSRFVDYPYDLPPSELIGFTYRGSELTSANANFFADAFANFGIVGIAVFAAVLGVMLALFNAIVERRLPLQLGAIVMSMPLLGLVNAALFTTLMSRGTLFAMVFVAVIPASLLNRLSAASARTEAPGAVSPRLLGTRSRPYVELG